MTLYSNTPTRRTLQIVTDVALIIWTVALCWLAWVIGARMRDLGEAGRQLRDGGSTFDEQMSTLAQKAGDIPLVGTSLQEPFHAAAGAGVSVREAGETFATNIDRLGWLLAATIALSSLFVAVMLWLGLRLPWVRRASVASRRLQMPGGDALLAWDALEASKPASLLAVHPDPVTAWRMGDPAATRGLADLRLAQLGLRRPVAGVSAD
ncbi:hypothetical protein [Branchiibius sp. NY16-3462-2]|uniref:hypothetical protein n=1 Tax=Branchiibius sp. NY16-3462-2 TaxID=1807500 RepID=UPI00079523F4|nr:hypothetical protein [Branchiibius sp. NY16-3462-2]KYH44704.1 hypothetical protein AZH51_03475 [Branchiibius sp. NY16-3462-2]